MIPFEIIKQSDDYLENRLYKLVCYISENKKIKIDFQNRILLSVQLFRIFVREIIYWCGINADAFFMFLIDRLCSSVWTEVLLFVRPTYFLLEVKQATMYAP